MSDGSTNRPQGTGLPASWCLAAFDDAFEVISDECKRIPQSEYLVEGVLPVVDQGEDFIGGYTNKQDQAYSGPLPIIIFGDHTRRVKYVDFPFAVGAQGVKLLRPRAVWFPRFLLYLLPTLDLANRGYSRHFQYLRKLPLPLAPVQEQVRIVGGIEKHFTRLDAAVAALKRVQANLKRYRTSVLKAACGGRLVQNEAQLARAEGRSYEPASELLKRILRDRRARWEADQVAKMRASSKVPTDEKWKTKYTGPMAPDTERLPQLPQGWAWTTVDSIGVAGEQSVLTGPFGTTIGRSDFVSSGVPVLTIGCLEAPGVSLKKAVAVSPEKAKRLERYRLREGDLLFSRMASVGRAGIVGAELSGALFNYHLMRLRLSPEVILSKFFIAYVHGSPQVELYARRVNHGVTRPGINTDQLLAMPVALPPLAEQRRVAVEVDRRLSVIDEIQMEVDADLKRAGRLRQAVSKRAFEGKLVAQDPNDEPASVLLERIRGTATLGCAAPPRGPIGKVRG